MGLCCKYGKKSEYETEEEYEERARSHFIVFFTQFNVVISYSTILIGIWPYLVKIDPSAGKSFLGYLVGASALGQTIFSPLIGWWSNKLNSSRVPFIVSLVVLLLSHLIYATLEIFPHKKYWMLASRFLAGVGSSNFALCRSHVSSTTLVKERRKVVTILSSCATVSFALGPAIQSMTIPFGETGVWLIPNTLKLDMYTAVGWIGLIISVINMLLFMPSVFQEHPMNKREEISPEKDVYRSKNYKILAMLFILLNFSLTFNFMFLKVLGTPLVMDEYAMTRARAMALNSIVVIVGAAISFVSILLINPVSKFFSEITLLIFSLLLMIIGRFCFYPFTNETVVTYNDVSLNETELSNTEYVGCPLSQQWCAGEGKIFFFQFILGNALENVGYAIAITLTMTIFSQVLGSKKQGTWMGFLTAFGSLARITSPVFITFLYEQYGPRTVTIVTNTMFALISIFVMKTSHHLFINKNNDIDDAKEQLQEDKPGKESTVDDETAGGEPASDNNLLNKQARTQTNTIEIVSNA